jgi:hypothetical protein
MDAAKLRHDRRFAIYPPGISAEKIFARRKDSKD